MNGLSFRLRWMLPALVPLTLTACSSAAFTVANLPTYFEEITVVRDQVYGPHSSHLSDIYMSAQKPSQPREVIVFFYGGRWTEGTKHDYRFVGATFAGRGYLVVIPDYRKYPAVRFPAFVEDAARAVAWVHDHIVEWHGDPHRIHVVGHSAGAHIGALLAADAHYLADLGKDRSVIRDVVGLAGPYSFTPSDPDLQDLFGPPADYPTMQVTTFIDGTQPPMLLLHGKDDARVSYRNQEKLRQRITEQGGCVRTIVYPDVGHSGILAALSWLNPGSAPVVEDIVRFFRSCE
ncbi:MAG: alpha/beta hydrolase [Nitrospira sp.]|nr:alpha/beta hydrolase [Nitrospira sp.]